VARSQFPGAAAYVPAHAGLPVLADAVQSCRGCDLYQYATQAVLGEGPRAAQLVLVGEQPGNDEDLAGRPFVGPAGRILDRALADAGIDRAEVYVTNAVKHFKFEERGKRRIHKKPGLGEIRACYPWLEAELAVIHPAIIGILGATAAQALMGSAFRLTKERGKPIPRPAGDIVIATIHPSAILRAPDDDSRHAEYARFVDDLKAMRSALHRASHNQRHAM